MEKSSFFGSIDGDRRYKAEDWAAYFASFIGNGVFPTPSTGLQVVADGQGMEVAVSPGAGWINGYFYRNTTSLTLPLSVADGVLSRMDRVVLRWDRAARSMYCMVKTGTPSEAPAAPQLQRDADGWELCLADVLIPAGAIAQSQSGVTDQRLNTDLCGIVHGVVDQVDTTTLALQLQTWMAEFRSQTQQEMDDFQAAKEQEMDDFQAAKEQEISDYQAGFESELNQYKTDKQQEIDAFQSESESDFMAWFQSIVDILDENVAGNLLNLINDHTGNTANPHGVTAAQVGARPDDWTPTAAQVGARPEDWTPTAEEVGAATTGAVSEALGQLEEQLGQAIALKGDKAVQILFTLLSGSWTGDAAPYTQTVSVEGLGENQLGFTGIVQSATAEQREAAAAARLSVTGQGAGSITITADGDLPAVDIPCSITMLG